MFTNRMTVTLGRMYIEHTLTTLGSEDPIYNTEVHNDAIWRT
jgi:hypothetical protein